MEFSNLQDIKNRFQIVGNNPKIERAIETAIQVANTELSIIIFGESGVGKEVFSKIIHQLSSRKHNMFVPVNCGAIPEGTIDSELFGHEKGSFTGAQEKRKGYFEYANGGTLFLDEIGELPLATQSKLLRVLENKEFIRVGSSKVLQSDVRVITATNKDLLEAIEQKKFREDLYYRLNTIPIDIPPLRERSDDIPLLFRKFVSDFSRKYKRNTIKLDDAAFEILKNFRWPGNIRQLKNIAEQICTLENTQPITEVILRKYIPNISSTLTPSIKFKKSENEVSEKELLYKLLFEMKGGMNELKKLVIEIIKKGNFDINPLEHNIYIDNPNNNPLVENVAYIPQKQEPIQNSMSNFKKVNPDEIKPFNVVMEEVDHNLSLLDKEKEFIVKALKKHKGKRKPAAQDLGISERTLYRKIKDLNL